MKTEQELELGQLIERARAAFDALSPADQALLSDDQRRSFVRGQTGRDPGASVLADEVRSLRADNAALLSRTEQAEARVKELEEEIERRAAQEEMDDALRDGCMDSLLAAESSLKERDEEVARLREALDEIATHPGPHADEAAHWRADTARSALSHQGGKAS